MSPKIVSPEEIELRELEMLEQARQIIYREGEPALTIDKLVKALPYSKGTVYNHFTGKEDILLALTNLHMKKVVTLYQRAVTFDGTKRERGLALHFGFLLQAIINPQEFQMVMSAKTANCIEKASQRRQDEHTQLEGQIVAPIFNLFQSAVDTQECKIPPHMSVMQFCFSCWSLSFGSLVLMCGNNQQCGIRSELSMERELMNGINLLFDGIQWQPLTQDADWLGSIQRMKNEIFYDEMAQLEAQGIELSL